MQHLAPGQQGGDGLAGHLGMGDRDLEAEEDLSKKDTVYLSR